MITEIIAIKQIKNIIWYHLVINTFIILITEIIFINRINTIMITIIIIIIKITPINEIKNIIRYHFLIITIITIITKPSLLIELTIASGIIKNLSALSSIIKNHQHYHCVECIKKDECVQEYALNPRISPLETAPFELAPMVELQIDNKPARISPYCWYADFCHRIPHWRFIVSTK